MDIKLLQRILLGMIVVILIVVLVSYFQFRIYYSNYQKEMKNYYLGDVTLSMQPGTTTGKVYVPYPVAKAFSLYPDNIKATVGDLVVNETEEGQREDNPLIGQFVEGPILIRTNEILTQIYNRYDALFGDFMDVVFDNTGAHTVPPIEIEEGYVLGLLWSPDSEAGMFLIDETYHNTALSRGNVEDLQYIIDINVGRKWNGNNEVKIPIYSNYNKSFISRMHSIMSDVDQYNIRYNKSVNAPVTVGNYLSALVRLGSKYMTETITGKGKNYDTVDIPTPEEIEMMVQEDANAITESFHAKRIR